MTKREPQTLQEAGARVAEAFNECGRLLRIEVERTARKIEAIAASYQRKQKSR